MLSLEKAETVFQELIKQGLNPKKAFHVVNQRCCVVPEEKEQLDKMVRNFEQKSKIVSKYSSKVLNPKKFFKKIFGINLNKSDVIAAKAFYYGIGFLIASPNSQKLKEKFGFKGTQKALLFLKPELFELKELTGLVSVGIFDLNEVKKAMQQQKNSHTIENFLLESDYFNSILEHEVRHIFQSFKELRGFNAKSSIELQLSNELAAIVFSNEKVSAQRLNLYIENYVKEAEQILKQRIQKQKNADKAFSEKELKQLPLIKKQLIKTSEKIPPLIEKALKKIHKNELASLIENNLFSGLVEKIEQKI